MCWEVIRLLQDLRSEHLILLKQEAEPNKRFVKLEGLARCRR